jgi:2-amino-4-hydroxy-6-hydroxymethyldihydropteridine diphosphokinase
MSPARCAYVGLGSNLDDPVRQVLAAFEELDRLPQTRVTARSSLYRTAPIGKLDQSDFINAVARLDTDLAAVDLLRALVEIEVKHGRVRRERDAPRTLDLDLLLYAQQAIRQPGLEVPHPRLHERAFVLVPLSEIDPDLVIPSRGRIADLLAAVADQRVSRIDSGEE